MEIVKRNNPTVIFPEKCGIMLYFVKSYEIPAENDL